MTTQLKQAKLLIQQRRKKEAVALLVPMLKADKDNVDAWALMVAALDDPQRKARAQRELQRLRGVQKRNQPSPPNETPSTIAPPDTASPKRRSNRRRLLLGVVGLFVVSFIAAGVLLGSGILFDEADCGSAETAGNGILYSSDYYDHLWPDYQNVLIDPADPDDDNRILMTHPVRGIEQTSDSQPSWSPDGTQIVYSSLRAESWLPDVYITSADPEDRRNCRLTFDGDNAPPAPSVRFRIYGYFSQGNYPRWSPDGTQVVFNSQVTGDFELYMVDANGENRRQLTDSEGRDIMADWSPDGSQIVFVSERDGDHDLYLMNADGTETRQLLDLEDNQVHPRWSPDGSRIVFTTTTYDLEFGGHWWEHGDLFVVDVADGSVETLIATPGIGEFQPTWSSDGSQILYLHQPAATDTAMYVIDADGGEPQELFRHANHTEYHPDWR